MAIQDILSQQGDKEALVLEIPEGNQSYVPSEITMSAGESDLCAEIPEVVNSGSNIFIMSE